MRRVRPQHLVTRPDLLLAPGKRDALPELRVLVVPQETPVGGDVVGETGDAGDGVDEGVVEFAVEAAVVGEAVGFGYGVQGARGGVSGCGVGAGADAVAGEGDEVVGVVVLCRDGDVAGSGGDCAFVYRGGGTFDADGDCVGSGGGMSTAGEGGMRATYVDAGYAAAAGSGSGKGDAEDETRVGPKSIVMSTA